MKPYILTSLLSNNSVFEHPIMNSFRCLMPYAGHSLGGVMAVLAAYDIADLCPWASLQVYTVGAPRPGNRAFAQQYNVKVPHTWHVINPQVRQQAAGTSHTHTLHIVGPLFVQLHESSWVLCHERQHVTELARASTCLCIMQYNQSKQHTKWARHMHAPWYVQCITWCHCLIFRYSHAGSCAQGWEILGVVCSSWAEGAGKPGG